MNDRVRPYLFYDVAISICSRCFRKVEGKIVFCDGKVLMLKRCPVHGIETVMMADDVDYYRKCREVFLKPPEQAAVYNTPVRWGCPYDCGLCRTTDTSSSAAHAAGEPNPETAEKPNDQSKNNKDAGQKKPGNVAFRNPGTSTTEIHQKNRVGNSKPFAQSALTAHMQRVSIADSFGASPAFSALDVSARRDPGGNCLNLTRNCATESGLAKLTSAR